MKIECKECEANAEAGVEVEECTTCEMKAHLANDLAWLTVSLSNAGTSVENFVEKNTVESRRDLRKMRQLLSERFDTLIDTLSHIDPN